MHQKRLSGISAGAELIGGGTHDQANAEACEALFLALFEFSEIVQLTQLLFGEFIRLHHAFRNYQTDRHPECKNREYEGHVSGTFPGLDTCGENDHSHPNPQAENAWHPDSHEKSIVVADEKPESDTPDKADKSADEEWVVYFVKHYRCW